MYCIYHTEAVYGAWHCYFAGIMLPQSSQVMSCNLGPVGGTVSRIYNQDNSQSKYTKPAFGLYSSFAALGLHLHLHLLCFSFFLSFFLSFFHSFFFYCFFRGGKVHSGYIILKDTKDIRDIKGVHSREDWQLANGYPRWADGEVFRPHVSQLWWWDREMGGG